MGIWRYVPTSYKMAGIVFSPDQVTVPIVTFYLNCYLYHDGAVFAIFVVATCYPVCSPKRRARGNAVLFYAFFSIPVRNHCAMNPWMLHLQLHSLRLVCLPL